MSTSQKEGAEEVFRIPVEYLGCCRSRGVSPVNTEHILICSKMKIETVVSMSLFDLMAWKDLQTGALLASNAISAYTKTLQLGFIELEIDLQNAKPYNHDNREGDYNDKNLYFIRANNLGMSLLRQNATGFSKMYYWQMLNIINNYETTANKPLNKGMVCGNLGVSSLAEGDVDAGIAYMAWAMREDRAWIEGNPENSIFANKLYVQFAEAPHRGGISQFGRAAPWVTLKKALEKYDAGYKERVDLSLIFKELEDSPQHRALFEGALWTIHRNLCLLREENERKIYKNENNVFTKLRLFDGIINMCRLTELRIRHHEQILKVLGTKDLEQALGGTLGTLLQKVFGKDWFKAEIPRVPKFRSPRAFDSFLKSKLTSRGSHIRDLLMLLVIRNYSVHLCDPSVPFFFGNIEQIFDDIIAAYVYYLKYRNLI